MANEVKFIDTRVGILPFLWQFMIVMADAWSFGRKKPKTIFSEAFLPKPPAFEKTLVATLMGKARTFCNLFFVMGT